MSGVDDTGLTIKTFEEINAEIVADELSRISPTLNTAPNLPIGQVNGVFARQGASWWEALAIAYNAFNRNAAEGVLLDNIGDLTGTDREQAKKSTVKCNITVGASFSQGPGVLVVSPVGQPNIKFANRNTVTSTTAGVYTGIDFDCTEYGPVNANAGTLTVITPVSGWTACTNPTDATHGRLIETDAEYRIRQRTELSASGNGTLDGMRADLLRIDGIQEVFVFENTSDATDSNGVPPHAFEVVIFDGTSPTADNQTIANTIWANKPSGIETYGTTSVTVTDGNGTLQLVRYSRAQVLTVYLTYSGVVIDSSFFPSDGIDQIKTAAELRGLQILKLGVDVISLQFKGAALSVPGVIDVPTLFLGFSPSPAGTANLVVGSRQIAKVDTSNILVSIA